MSPDLPFAIGLWAQAAMIGCPNGDALPGMRARLAELRGTAIGPFRLEDASSPDEPGKLLPHPQAKHPSPPPSLWSVKTGLIRTISSPTSRSTVRRSSDRGSPPLRPVAMTMATGNIGATARVTAPFTVPPFSPAG